MPVLTSAFGAQNVWVSNQRALWFLVWCNLLVLPQFCPRGHQWSFGGNEKGYQHLMCSSKLPVQMSEGGDEEEEHPTKRCGHKMSWRVQGTLPYYLPDCVSPAQYVHFLYWFCSDCPRGQMQKEVGLKTKTFAKLLKRCRDILWLSISKAMGSRNLSSRSGGRI